MNPLKSIDWRIFGILYGAGMLGVVAVLPFAMELARRIPGGDAPLPLPIPAIIALALVQNGILLALAVAAGMIVSERVGLRWPLVRAWARGAPAPSAAAVLLPGLLVGAAAGAILIGLEAALFLRALPASMVSMFDVPLWKRLLSGVLYGGVTEELLMRLFLMSLVAWVLGRWWKAGDGTPAARAFWLAIVVVAIVFGLGHLPATSAMAPLTPMLVTRALILNGIVGIAFGYLYWRHRLEAAMAGHMGAHLVMQVPGVMLLKSMLAARLVPVYFG